ncbi:MAG: alpha/beta hydrolase [Bdellovibrionales bacterium]
MKLIRNLLLLGAAIYFAALGYYTICQRDYIYFPQRHAVSLVNAESSSGMETLTVKTEDGLELTGWYVPARGSVDTIVFFHGTGDAVTNLESFAQPFVDAGYGFLLAEYRGYGGMPGKPTENGVYADARAFIGKLFDKGVELNKIIVMGHSMGAAVALQVAREFHVAGLVMISPFTSLPKLAAEYYPYFPTGLVVWDRFANDYKMPKVQLPLLLVHGDQDKTVPLAQGLKLFSLANEPKTLHRLEEAGHNDILEPATPIILDWLSALAP